MNENKSLEDALNALGHHRYEYAFEMLLPLAHESNATAQYHVGTFFDDGLLVAEDTQQAIYWYEKSSANGCIYADAALGHLCSPEIDGPSDKERSDALIEKAVIEFTMDRYQHDVEAHFWLGYFCFLGSRKKRNLAKASAHFLIGAKSGHTKCMASFSLADILLNYGSEGSFEPCHSLEWANEAVKLGSPLASEMLASFYATGGILGKNPGKEFQYRLLAAEGGVVGEMLEVGKLYEFGQGTDSSVLQAAKWYLKASRCNLSKAHYFAATLDMRNDGFRISERRKLSLLWQSAAQKYPPALYLLSREYRGRMRGNPSIEKEADCLLVEAAELGDVRAMHEYGYRLAFGDGPQQQEEVGFELIRKAADGENYNAYFDLAHCYAFGLGVERSLSEAVRCHEVALTNGIFKSAAYLGFLYSDTEFSGYDPSKALGYQMFAHSKIDEPELKDGVKSKITDAKKALPRHQVEKAYSLSSRLEAHFRN